MMRLRGSLILALLLWAAMLFTLAGCGNNNSPSFPPQTFRGSPTPVSSGSPSPSASPSPTPFVPAATGLKFNPPPTPTVAKQVIPTITVDVVDQQGNPFTNFSGAITLSLQNPPSGVTLSGTLTENASNGVAQFSGLVVNQIGSYTLVASATGLQSGTTTLSIIAVPALSLSANRAILASSGSEGSIQPAVQSADFNGDGILDIATIDADGGVGVYLGLGGGAFNDTPSYYDTTFGSGSSLAIADFNGDGKLDLCVSDPVGTQIGIYTGNGDGTFNAPKTFFTTNSLNVIQQARLDEADSFPDIVGTDGSNIVVLKNQTTTGNALSFSAASVTAVPGGNVNHLVANKFGNHTHADIAVATGAIPSFGSAPANGSVKIFFGNGSGGFTNSGAPDTIAVGKVPIYLATADVDGDGNADLVVANQNTYHDLSGSTGTLGTPTTPQGTVSIELLDSTVTPKGTSTTVNAGPDPSAVAIGHFNSGSSLPSIVVFNEGNDWDDTDLRDNPVQTAQQSSVQFIFQTAAGTFAAATSPSTFGSSSLAGIAAGDLDGDGITDVISGDEKNGTAVIGFANGSGALKSVNPLTAPVWPYDVRTSMFDKSGNALPIDFNHDGNPDFVVEGGPFETNFAVVLGDGKGGILSTTTINTGLEGLHAVAVGDIDGDGNLDLVVTCAEGGADSDDYNGVDAGPSHPTLQFYKGDGTGKFTLVNSFTITTASTVYQLPVDVALADFNNDGMLDVAVVNEDGDSGGSNAPEDQLLIFLGDGKFDFGTPATFNIGNQAGARCIALADLNHDGNTDVVFGNQYSINSETQAVVSYMLGDGTGSFGSLMTFDFTLPTNTQSQPIGKLLVADVDQDGNQDIIVSGQYAEYIGIIPTDSSGALQTPSFLVEQPQFTDKQSHSWNPKFIAVGDFNGDRIPDIASVNEWEGSMTVFLNNGFGSFQPGQSFSVGRFHMDAIGALDLNKDGKDDIITLDHTNQFYNEGTFPFNIDKPTPISNMLILLGQ